MYENVRAPEFKGYKGDGPYEYKFVEVVNPNTKPEDVYFVLRIRKIALSPEPNLHRGFETELADLYASGYYDLGEYEYGHMKIEGGTIQKVTPWGNHKGVFGAYSEKRKVSIYETQVRDVFTRNKPSEIPPEIPMKHKAVVFFGRHEGTKDTWFGPLRDTFEEATADALKAMLLPERSFLCATHEIISQPCT